MVAEAEIQADMVTTPEADPATPAGDMLLIGVDGTTSFTDGDWHEVKVGVVGMLGPELQHNAETGRDLLKVSDPHYCAAVATEADEFFPRVAQLARQAGFGHPSLRRVVCLGDGGRWIWNRTPVFRQDGVEHIEILDYMHASEHVFGVADVFFGEGTLDAHAWVGPVLRALLDQSPTPLMEALGTLRPRSARQKRELQNAKDYFTANRDRMRYPDFIAQQLPIGSRVVEATCRSLVCQRTKGAAMRWTKAGAQAVLNLLRLHLSHPDRWRSLFARHPLRRTPHLAALRQPQTQAA